MVKFKEPLEQVRNKVKELQIEIQNNPFFETPSLLKKKNSKGGYYLHATDDIPEVRLKMFELISTLKCSFEAVVGRKNIERYLGDKVQVFDSNKVTAQAVKNKLEFFIHLRVQNTR